MRLRQLVAETEVVLRTGPHPERARLDAETLLLHLLAQNRAWLLAHMDDAADSETQAALGALIMRRSIGEPIQYITGHAEFFGLPFAVAPGVLIPRPETEHLVEEVIRLAGAFTEPRIADIGTGSGAIAVALANALPDCWITATDLSPQALKIARSNADRNGVANRIEFLEGDLLAPLAGRSFSILASNPPYVPLRDRTSLSAEVRAYEPHSALFAGDDGLDIYRRLIPDARSLLVAGGWLVMEIGFGQQDAVEKLLLASSYCEVHFVPDYQGIPRVAACRRA
jgi:release factor glutamine methyltransferase